MWDTSKDYRLLVAEKSIDLFTRTIEGGNFKGHWKKKLAIQTAREMGRELQAIIYSYMEPQDLLVSPQISTLKEKIEKIQEYLGGEDWSKHFLELANRDEKEKLEENIAKVRFFLNTFLNLEKRISLGPINDPIIGIDIIVGEIMSVSKHPQADNLLICNVNVGLRAMTIVTNDLEVKDGNHVAISLLPPSTFMGVTSEGMFLGAGEGILKNVDGNLGEIPHGIPLDALNEARNLVENFLKG
ncbi:tRNA-binding protein [Methanobacterium alcaliphilum]|uniref:tRNA-binding protein n=1 Tax=Methanobacterium alcaliphilum TaxID=392018 RepID=UPI00200B4B9F|nr:tRNA-binding protein [Methanobacterium alcaliphilum]MCK9150337.1 tRNA-binding protein [Methanobacterium alcaliphilum]